METIVEAKQAMERAGLRARLMLDCSHGNSSAGYMNQVKQSANRISNGDIGIMGVSIKSNIFEGSFTSQEKNISLLTQRVGRQPGNT